jgi:PST family polysaccharide transporter
MATARVIGEATLAVILMVIMVRLELVGLVPGARRAAGMLGLAWGARAQAGATKDD